MLRMHKSQQNTSLSTVAVAALVGGLAGVVAGLMLAPKSGKELRQGICKKSDHAREHVGDVASHHVGALKQQGTDIVDKGKQLAEDLQTFIQESLKMKKSSPIPLTTSNATQTEDPLQNEPEMDPQAITEFPLPEDS